MITFRLQYLPEEDGNNSLATRIETNNINYLTLVYLLILDNPIILYT